MRPRPQRKQKQVWSYSMTTNESSKQQKQQRLTYYKEHKYHNNRYKASIAQLSPPKALLVLFLFGLICNGAAPATFENRCTRWKQNVQSTTPACCLIVIGNLSYILLLYVTYMSNQGRYKISNCRKRERERKRKKKKREQAITSMKSPINQMTEKIQNHMISKAVKNSNYKYNKQHMKTY